MNQTIRDSRCRNKVPADVARFELRSTVSAPGASVFDCGNIRAFSRDWCQYGHAAVAAHQGRKFLTLVPKRALVTLPLGVLQASCRESGAVRFTPSRPLKKVGALKTLQMRKVIRVALRFRTRLWETIRPAKNSSKTLSHMNYLLLKTIGFPPRGQECSTKCRWSQVGHRLAAPNDSRTRVSPLLSSRLCVHLPLR
jgi:hypothetical protein